MFAKLLSVPPLVCLIFISAGAQVVSGSVEIKNAGLKKDSIAVEPIAAKKAAADTVWKPLRRLWGYGFGDI